MVYALIGGTGGPFYSLDVQYFTPREGQVVSQGGLTAVVSRNLNEITNWRPAVLVVIGGLIWETDDAPDINRQLREVRNEGSTVAGICGGTLALARAGLLSTVLHTSNDQDFLIKNAPGYSGFEYYRESATAMVSDRVITAPGAAPVSFTAAVFNESGMDQDSFRQLRKMMAREHLDQAPAI